jgi:hypothetical protein
VVFGLVALALVALIALVWGSISARNLRTARTRAAVLDERVQTLQEELATMTTRSEAAETNAAKSVALADTAAKRALEAEAVTALARADADAAHERAEAADQRATESDAARAAAESARDDAAVARDRAAVAAGAIGADALWQLEAARIERLWRDRVALPGDETRADAEDDLATLATSSIGIMAAASREESGVVVDVSCTLSPEVPRVTAWLVVRLAEELVAAARQTDGAELHVTVDDDGGARLELRAGRLEAPDDLVELVDRLGGSLSVGDGGLVVALDAPAVAEEATADPSSGEPAQEGAAGPEEVAPVHGEPGVGWPRGSNGTGPSGDAAPGDDPAVRTRANS